MTGVLRGFLGRLLAALLILMALAGFTPPSSSAAGPITTPKSALRFYQQSVNRGLCAQAYKVISFGLPSTGLRPFLKQCAAIKHLTIAPILDPGYRISRLNATYTCLGVQLRAVLRNGAIQSSGGWYFMEKTPFVFWHILLAWSHLTAGERAVAPLRSTCAAAIPTYARPSSAQRVIGSAFLSATTGWIAVSRSGAYVPTGSCNHGIGTNCNTAQTIIYGTADAGAHWRKLLSLITAAGPALWIRLFNRNDGLIAAGVGAKDRGMLYRTSDGGRTWRHAALPGGYVIDPSAITFPDPRHGWLYFGAGAAGSMGVTIFATANDGRRWRQIACTAIPIAPPPCRIHAGIPFAGDKTFLTFVTDRSGWLGIASNGGTPALLHSTDGGRSWDDQHVGLPPGVHSSPSLFVMGTFDRPHIFGQTGILPESVGFARTRPPAKWSRRYVYQSRDAGTTWHLFRRTPLPAPSATSFGSNAETLTQFPDARHWIAVVGNTIWQTANAGATWSHALMHVPRGLQLAAMTFIDPIHGWAEAGVSGGEPGANALLRTVDGGVTWRRVTVPKVPSM